MLIIPDSPSAEPLTNQPNSHGSVARISRRAQLLFTVVLLSGPCLLLASRFFPSLNTVIFSDPIAHVSIALVSAVLGILLALLVLQVAQRLRDGRVLLIGITLLSSALFFLIHAITTPGIWFGPNPVVSPSAQLSLMIAGIILGISSLNIGPALGQWLVRHTWLVIIATLFGWMLLSVWLSVQPYRASNPATAITTTSTHDHVAAAPVVEASSIVPSVVGILLSVLWAIF
jgi:hypothetical protein